MKYLTIREIKDAALFDLYSFKHELVTGSLWEYKDNQYRLLRLDETTLIQYEDSWYPIIEYSEYYGIGKEKLTQLSFTRAVPDFLSKFKRVG